MRRYSVAAVLFIFLLAFNLQAQENRLQVLATTTIIADIAQNVGGDLLDVSSLVPPDTDIHAFELLPSDVRLLETSDILLVNGAGLEAFLGRLLETVPSVEPVVVGNGIEVLAFGEHEDEETHEEGEQEHEHHEAEIIGILGEEGVCEEHHEDEEATEEVHEDGEDEHEHGECDPHFWTNPQNVMIMADNIAATFAEADPDNAETYFANAESYKAELTALDAEIVSILSLIPEERRVLITNHEFLAYFAAHYDFEILATVIPNTLSEPSPQELSELVELIREENVPVIFAEVSDSNRLAEVVAAEVGQDVDILSLYSDSLSSADGMAATYLDYLLFNANTIATALSN